MCEILLIRHGHCPSMEVRLLGRGADITLSRWGRNQAEAIASSLRNAPIVCVQSSPQIRCIDTAKPLAKLFQLPIQIEPRLDEIDFGRWTGRSFASLCSDPGWIRWNQNRAEARPPGGESMAEGQARAVAHLTRVRRAYEGGLVAMITHAEIIRAVGLYEANLPLGRWREFEVAPATITRFSCTSSLLKSAEEMAA